MPGFGYGDYKVVSIGKDNGMFYSLLTDPWRIIEGFKGCLGDDRYGKYANGKIYWLFCSLKLEIKIVSLDMVSDKFGELKLPEYYESPFSKRRVDDLVLGVSNGRLFLLYNHDSNKTELWVMDMYGDQESWSKMVSIPARWDKKDSTHQIVCILRNGEIVMSDGSDLMVYNSKHEKWRNIELVTGLTVCNLRNDRIVVSDGRNSIVYHSKHKEFNHIKLWTMQLNLVIVNIMCILKAWFHLRGPPMVVTFFRFMKRL